MRFSPVEDFPELGGSIYLSLLEVEDAQVRVCISHDWLTFFHLTFTPYQGLRLTTEDCFQWPDEFDHFHTLVSVLDSPWVRQLQADLRANYPHADFLKDAHHFLLPSRHTVIEVVAWKVIWNAGSART